MHTDVNCPEQCLKCQWKIKLVVTLVAAPSPAARSGLFVWVTEFLTVWGRHQSSPSPEVIGPFPMANIPHVDASFCWSQLASWTGIHVSEKMVQWRQTPEDLHVCNNDIYYLHCFKTKAIYLIMFYHCSFLGGGREWRDTCIYANSTPLVMLMITGC